MPLKILMIAGEPSGDRLGANLIDGLKYELRGLNTMEVQGIGGSLMKSKGLKSIFDLEDISYMGFVEILPNVPKILNVIKRISNYAIAWRPDVIITIDSPDFSSRVSKKIKRIWPEAKIIHYVVPSVWAWRPKRAKKMAKFVDHVLAILPFEPPFMTEVGLSCEFVGHPVVSEEMPSQEEIRSFRNSMNIKKDDPIVAILPGSRKSEVFRMIPIFDDMIRVISSKYPNLLFIIPITENVSDIVIKWVNKTNLPIIYIKEKDNDPMVFEWQKRLLFSTALAAVATSGTVSLELARMGAPMVIAYRTSIITELLYKLLVNLKTATLINILTERMDIPEFLFEKCTFKNLSFALNTLLIDNEEVLRQQVASNEAMELLGLGGTDPKIRAARSVLKFIKHA